MEPEPSPAREERSRFPAAFALGAVIIFLVVGALVLLSRLSHPALQAAKLPFGPSEQAYSAHVHFQDVQLAHSTNLLNQEFTYVSGTISNNGTRAVGALEVVIEFYDPFNQVILRETEKVIQSTDTPLRDGEQRMFQVTIEQGIPSEWNREKPSIRISGLLLK